MRVKIRRWSPHYERWEYFGFLTLREYTQWLLSELNNHCNFDETYEEVRGPNA